MLRYFAVLATAVCLAGCDNITAAFTPAADRINAAFPLPDELQIASAHLLGSLEADKAELQRTTDQLDNLRKVRALTCTATVPVGRFDPAAKIRSKVTDTTCFQQQDALLADWVGTRRLGLALREAPAYPLAALPAKGVMPNFDEHISMVAAAEQANVLVIQGQRLTSFQLPGGKKINSYEGFELRGGRPALSPNGRLLAVPLARGGLRILDVASGATIWSTDKYTVVIAWLPKLDVIVLSLAGTGAPHFMDTRRGTLEPYPAAEKNLTWSLPVDGNKLLVGTSNTVSMMRHSRSNDGALDITPARQWTLPGYRDASALPHLMSNGRKLVYTRRDDIAWLNLETGEQGAWPVFPRSVQIAKVSDTTLLFDSSMPGSTSTASRLLDVDKLTIADAKDLSARDGDLFSLVPRTGYLKRSANAVLVGGAVEAENVQDLNRVIAEVELAQQLAKLKESDPCAPRETLAGLGNARTIWSSNVDCGPGAAPGAPRAPMEKPLLANVQGLAKLSVIGVYAPEGATHRAGSDRKASPIRINVAPGSTPLMLALASHEPVTWVINNPTGRKLQKIMLSGQYESNVVGHGYTQVVKIGSSHAYKPDGPGYPQLKRDIARYTYLPVAMFQGAYKGREFTVQ